MSTQIPLISNSVPLTQEHINKGRQAIHDKCPIALALKDHTGVRWSVSSYNCTRHGTGGPTPHRPNFSIKYLIRTFDGGDPIEPCTFPMPIPHPG